MNAIKELGEWFLDVDKCIVLLMKLLIEKGVITIEEAEEIRRQSKKH